MSTGTVPDPTAPDPTEELPGRALPGMPDEPSSPAAFGIAPRVVSSAPPHERGVFATFAHEALEGTPGTMRIFATISVLAALLFAVLGFVAINNRANALADAQIHAEQLVRLQTIRTNLVQADADATNAFLVGGLEPGTQRAAYETSIAAASTTLAQASGESSADAVTLADVNDHMTTYTGLIEAARANNRQGFPVGAAYLKNASALLRGQVLPDLTALANANENRVQDAYNRSDSAGDLLAIVGVLAVVVLLVAQIWLTVRTRRWINVGVLSAVAGVLVALIVSGSVMVVAQSTAQDVRAGAYQSADAIGQARVAAFDAKSSESLTLIERGSGQDAEANYKSEHVVAQNELALAAASGANAKLQELLTAYDQVHQKIRSLDDGGQWDDAVKLATGDANVAGSSNQTFQALDAATQQDLLTSSQQVSNQLGDARTTLEIARWLVLLVGLLAAAAAGWGFSRRLREYR
jgi:hypothetical protein